MMGHFLHIPHICDCKFSIWCKFQLVFSFLMLALCCFHLWTTLSHLDAANSSVIGEFRENNNYSNNYILSSQFSPLHLKLHLLSHFKYCKGEAQSISTMHQTDSCTTTKSNTSDTRPQSSIYQTDGHMTTKFNKSDGQTHNHKVQHSRSTDSHMTTQSPTHQTDTKPV